VSTTRKFTEPRIQTGPLPPFAVHDREPGRGIHEVGIARMANDPKKSVLNQFQQSHDIKNLFVTDGSGFTSSACQNPTLTIMALCAAPAII